VTERLFRALYRIRRVEEEIARVYPTDKVMSPVHLSIGQEAVSVGVCEALGPEDVVFGSYRCHALYLAKGGDLRGMIAELYGKAAGCAKGKAGSMHLIDTSAGVMGASAVVATTIPLAVGYAMAERMRGRDTVVASFFGDGAVEEGVFHEALNFASLKKLPVLFVCENNSYAIHSRESARRGGPEIIEMARAHAIPAVKLERMDTLEIVDRVGEAVRAIRQGGGPRLFEVMCYRWREHVGPNEDFHFGYRDRSEAEPWFQADQVEALGRQLPPQDRRRVEAEVEVEIRDAFAFAEAAPLPHESELYTDLYQDAWRPPGGRFAAPEKPLRNARCNHSAH
jgi:TPP-dependent pyruvate/acetoin dehydrogenase alpha subunit